MIQHYHQLFSQLTEQTLVITANRRLTAHLQSLYLDYQISHSKKVWTTLDILPLNSWLVRCWQFAQDDDHSKNALLLTPLQEQLIWEHIINQFNQHPLIEIENTALLAQQAWELLHQWNAIDKISSCQHPTEDTRLFQQWTNQYSLRATGLIGPSQLYTYLKDWFKTTPNLPSKIYFVGFTELPPALQSLLIILEKRGTTVELIKPLAHNNTKQHHVFKSTQDEIQAMANWAKQLLINNDIPHQLRIGCVVPNLTEIKNKISTVFEETFYLQQLFEGERKQSHLFNLSAGQPLQHYPMVLTALTLIECLSGFISTEKICYLLRSPFLAGGEFELHSRAKVEMIIYNLGQDHFSLQQLTSFFSHLPIFAKIWDELLRNIMMNSAKKSPIEWSQQWQALLTNVGWPGQRTLDSAEFQTLQRFDQTWLEWKQYQIISPQMTFAMAKQQFNKLCQTIIFQPRVPTAPIQILGTLEATGLTFDYVWIMGLDEETWPTPAKPNPFIPISLQRKLNLPHSSAERELQFCQEITDILLNSASNVIVSYAEQRDDMHVAASPLISHLDQTEFSLLTINPKLAQLIESPAEVITYSDNFGPSINALSKIPGGARLFQLQAACPFRAFAELRLNARETRSRESVHYTLRGKLIHAILQEFWIITKTHDQLCQLDTESIKQRLNTCLTTAWSKLQLGDNTTSQFLIEQIRLLELLEKWLQYEKKREPFTVVATEENKSIELLEFNIILSVVIDRIDVLPNSDHLIIDYKTSEISPAVWLNERPDDLQLPLYLTTLEESSVMGIAFGQLKPHKIMFKGLAADSTYLPNVKSANNWSQQISEWRMQIARLAEEFSKGYAETLPKDPKQTCKNCHLKMMCRIHEKNAACYIEVNDD